MKPTPTIFPKLGNRSWNISLSWWWRWGGDGRRGAAGVSRELVKICHQVSHQCPTPTLQPFLWTVNNNENVSTDAKSDKDICFPKYNCWNNSTCYRCVRNLSLVGFHRITALHSPWTVVLVLVGMRPVFTENLSPSHLDYNAEDWWRHSGEYVGRQFLNQLSIQPILIPHSSAHWIHFCPSVPQVFVFVGLEGAQATGEQIWYIKGLIQKNAGVYHRSF